jgi:hypothetical protein
MSRSYSNSPSSYYGYDDTYYGYDNYSAARFKAVKTSKPKKRLTQADLDRYYSHSSYILDDHDDCCTASCCSGHWSFEAKFFANVLFIVVMLWTLTHLQFLQQGKQLKQFFYVD